MARPWKMGIALLLSALITAGTSVKLSIKEDQWLTIHPQEAVDDQLHDIWYQNCYTQLAWKIEFLWKSEAMINRWDEGYTLEVAQIFMWGFKLRVRKTERYKPTNNTYESMKFTFRAFFNSSDYQDNPCHNNASCSNSREGHRCRCTEEYWGPLCQDRKVQCISNPCQFGGRCIEYGDDYKCECPIERTGKNCANVLLALGTQIYKKQLVAGPVVNVSYPGCYRDPAVNVSAGPSITYYQAEVVSHHVHGFSVRLAKTSDSPTPEMLHLYYVLYFENINQIEGGNPCLNGGSCGNTFQDYVCQCPPKFTGARCEFDLNDCSYNPCINGGTCTEVADGRHECVCPKGFGGQNCNHYVATGKARFKFPSRSLGRYNKPNLRRRKIVFDSCFSGYMLGLEVEVVGDRAHEIGAKVVYYYTRYFVAEFTKENGSNVRMARMKWTATFQNADFDANPCLNNGTCVNSDTSAGRCVCLDGFEGNSCEIAVANCASSPCLNGGSCQQNGRQFSCICAEGFQGETCADMTIEALAASEGIELETGQYLFGPHPYPCSDTKVVDVVYNRCYARRPRNVSASAVGDPQLPDRFEVTVAELTEWGFRARVRRVDKVDGWRQGDVELRWRALFDPRVVEESVCFGGFCHNSVMGHRCECWPQFTGESCGIRL